MYAKEKINKIDICEKLRKMWEGGLDFSIEESWIKKKKNRGKKSNRIIFFGGLKMFFWDIHESKT